MKNKITLKRSNRTRALWLGLCLPLSLLAQPKLELKMSTAVQVTEEVNGVTQVSYVEREGARPGETHLYTIQYLNSGDTPAVGAALIGVIPKGTRYLEVLDANKQVGVQFSIDSGKTFQAAPIKRTVTDADGSRSQQVAPTNAYTHIRFILKTPVAPNQSGGVRYLLEVL